MAGWAEEIEAFRKMRDEAQGRARQTAAFRLLTGIDLESAVESRGAARAAILVRVKRRLERERLKGQRRHWSYDLNRHIALKQAYDLLAGRNSCDRTGGGEAEKPAALQARQNFERARSDPPRANPGKAQTAFRPEMLKKNDFEGSTDSPKQ